MPPNGKTASSNGSRFELPQLTPVNFSLTEGTNIPPPPDSPIEEIPPPPAQKDEDNTPAPVSTTNGVANGNRNASNGSHEREPLSPASSKRPSSIRRFLSRRSLNSNYANGTNHNGSHEDLTGVPRPESAMSFTPSVAKKRGWFRKAWGGKRTSVVLEEKVSAGPPPPKLPELDMLKSKVADNDDGGLGGEDLFKNIK